MSSWLSKGIFFILILFVMIGCQKGSEKKESSNTPTKPKKIIYPKAKGGETRPTLPPENFKDRKRVMNAVEAYQAAKKIPQILDKIYCYCHCQESKKFQHKSLLTCYVDEHSAHCDLCQREAITAYNLHKRGHKVDEIVKIVNQIYYRPIHNHSH